MHKHQKLLAHFLSLIFFPPVQSNPSQCSLWFSLHIFQVVNYMVFSLGKCLGFTIQLNNFISLFISIFSMNSLQVEMRNIFLILHVLTVAIKHSVTEQTLSQKKSFISCIMPKKCLHTSCTYNFTNSFCLMQSFQMSRVAFWCPLWFGLPISYVVYHAVFWLPSLLLITRISYFSFLLIRITKSVPVFSL